MKNDQKFRFVVFEEDGIFVAQCLEFDVCTQAPDKETLRERVDFLMEIELEEMERTGKRLDPAPEVFHNMWESGGHTYRDVAA